MGVGASGSYSWGVNIGGLSRRKRAGVGSALADNKLRNAKNVGRHKWVAKQALVGCTGCCQRCSNESRGCDPWKANVEENRIDSDAIVSPETQDRTKNIRWWNAIRPNRRRDYDDGDQEESRAKEERLQCARRNSASTVEQSAKVLVVEIDLIKQLVERANLLAKITRRFVWIERMQQPGQADQAVH